MTKIVGSGYASGSSSQRHGSADQDPDPHQNVLDPQHCPEKSQVRPQGFASGKNYCQKTKFENQTGQPLNKNIPPNSITMTPSKFTLKTSRNITSCKKKLLCKEYYKQKNRKIISACWEGPVSWRSSISWNPSKPLVLILAVAGPHRVPTTIIL